MDEQARYLWINTNILPHEGEVRGWLRRHVRSLTPADVDDLLQEAYARLWSADFDRIGNGRSYFFTTVRNLLHEQARRARIVPMERMGEIEALRMVSDDPGPERRLGARQELERLQAVIAALPAQRRRAFELQKIEGLSQREIADRMGVSCSTVEKHLSRALAHIIEAMTQDGDERGSENAVPAARRYDNRHEQD